MNKMEEALQRKKQTAEPEATEPPKKTAPPLEESFYPFTEFVTDRTRLAKIPTGFTNIDSALNGGLSSRLYIIGAETSMGKTAFTWNIVENIARTGERHVLYFSLEMAAYEMMARTVSRRTWELNGTEEKKVQPLTEDEVLYSLTKITGERYIRYAKAAEAAKENEWKYIHVIEGRRDINSIELCVRKWINENPNEQPPVIVIDYLQLIAPTEDNVIKTQAPPETGYYKTEIDENGITLYLQTVKGTASKTPREQTDYNTAALMFIKRDLKTPIIAISAFNRTNSGSIEPDMTALKESGTIEYSADCVMLLSYNFTKDEIASVYSSKNEKAKKAAGFEQEANLKELFRTKAKDYPREMKVVFLKNRGGDKTRECALQYFSAYNIFRTKPGEKPQNESQNIKKWDKYTDENGTEKDIFVAR